MQKLSLAMFALLAACTAADPNAPELDANGGDTSPWIGTWSETGTQSTTCGASSGTTQISETIVISAAADASTIKTVADNCRLMWDLDGSSAALESGQVCTVSVNGFDVTVGWTQSTATLSGGTITVDSTGATNNGCSFMQQATLTKS